MKACIAPVTSTQHNCQHCRHKQQQNQHNVLDKRQQNRHFAPINSTRTSIHIGIASINGSKSSINGGAPPAGLSDGDACASTKGFCRTGIRRLSTAVRRIGRVGR
eukprot:3934589-Rhodomonas_salina.1